MDKFDNMKITIHNITTIDTGICIVFNISVNDVSNNFNSYLDFDIIKNKNNLTILDIAWENIYSKKILGWLQTITACKELSKMINTIYIPKPILHKKKSWF